MAELIIPIDDHDLAALQQCAHQRGVTVEQLVQSSITQLIDVTDAEFGAMVSEVLEKNAELYRRLANTPSFQPVFTLSTLLADITDANTHGAVESGAPLGNELL